MTRATILMEELEQELYKVSSPHRQNHVTTFVQCNCTKISEFLLHKRLCHSRTVFVHSIVAHMNKALKPTFKFDICSAY